MRGVRGLRTDSPPSTDPVDELALPADGGRRLDGEVVATEIVRGAGLIPGVGGVDFYRRFIDDLRTSCRLTPELNLFEFAYDWRLDNRVSAAELVRRCGPWLEHYRQVAGLPGAQLLFVAHSMGGLVVRYAVEVLDLWRRTHAVITIATPHRGSPKAARFLLSGVPGLSWYSRLTEVVRSLPSVHQLLPIYPMVRRGGALVRFTDPGLHHGLDRDRLYDGARFLYEIEDASRENGNEEDYARRGVRLSAVIGTHQPTIGCLAAGPSGAVGPASDGDEPGDGTVPMPAAHPIEWNYPETVMYAAGKHVSLAGMPAVRHHIIDLVRASVAPRGLAQYRGVDTLERQLILDSPDVISAGQPLELRVGRAAESIEDMDELDQWMEPGEVEVTITAIADERPVTGSPFIADRSGRCVVPGLAEGCYRIRVAVAGDGASAISDLVMVAPAD